MLVSLFDYGTGNLHSLGKALEAGGAAVRIDAEPTAALSADAVVLPGVGAFGPAADRLQPARDPFNEALEAGYPCLGICLGMQLLFEASDESPGRGLGLLAGRVRRLRADRVPQMGWNSVEPDAGAAGAWDPLFAGVAEPIAYYANSYVTDPDDPHVVIGWTTHEADRFAAAVRYRRTWGVQFHPEKSSAAGLQLIRNFLREASR